MIKKNSKIGTTFGSYIRELRIKNEIGQRELAKKIGLAPSYLNDIEKNKRSAPKNNIIKKLSLLLKVDLDLLNDLAGSSKNSLAPDIIDYLEKNPRVISLIRSAKNNKLNDEEILKIEESINFLISEYTKKNDQILIQKLIDKPDIAGVLFTKDKNTNSHYYQISFDTSKRSDLVTSGKFNPSLKSLITFKKSKKIPKKFAKLVETSKKLEKLSEIKFLAEKNDALKNEIINSLTEGNDKKEINLKIRNDYNKTVEEINENSNIHIIAKNKTDENISDMLEELIQDHTDQSNLKKIESLEKKLINNLDENSYSELIKLKSQLNRE